MVVASSHKIGANLIILLIVDFHMLYHRQENLTSPDLLLSILTIYSFSKVLKLFHLFLIDLKGGLTFSIRSFQDYLLGCYFIIFIYASFVIIDFFIFYFQGRQLSYLESIIASCLWNFKLPEILHLLWLCYSVLLQTFWQWQNLNTFGSLPLWSFY